MNKKLFFSAMLVFLLVFSLVIVSCGNGSSKLVGLWESEEEDFRIELFKDGTGNLAGKNATWKTENNRIMFAIGNNAISGEYKLSGKTLTLIIDGETSILKKK
jgi:hypothetical protein